MAQYLETLIDSGQARRLSSAIPRSAREGWAPASIAQERLFELQHALPEVPFLNILYALRLTSSVDVAVLERSINEIVRRHEILRTTFDVEDGRHVQVIASQLTVPLRFEDLHGLPESKMETAGHRLIQEEALHPSTSREALCCGLACCAWPSENTSCSSACTKPSATVGRSACSSRSLPPYMTPFPPDSRRHLRRSRFSTRTLRAGSGNGGHIRKSLRSSHTGASSCTIRCR